MSINMKKAKWKIINHTMSNTYDHNILVGYVPRGRDHERMNEIFFLAPLYNLNDKNMDGSVSMLEWWYSLNLYDPYSVFELMNTADKTSCVVDAATQLSDYDLRNKANMKLLESAYKVSARALTTLTVERFLSTSVDQGLAITFAGAVRHQDKIMPLLKFGAEFVVDEIITRSQGVRY